MDEQPLIDLSRSVYGYGYCPTCGSPSVSRERRPNGNDKCENGHTYPSKEAILLTRGNQ